MKGGEGVNSETRFVCEWIDRMTQKHGGSVYDMKTGRTLDWGQALAFHRYGYNNPDQPDGPDTIDMETAKQWEAGSIPQNLRLFTPKP